jgi:hypothetical protein
MNGSNERPVFIYSGSENEASMGTVGTMTLVVFLVGSVVAGGLVTAGPGAESGGQTDRAVSVPQQSNENETVTETDAEGNGSLGGEVSAFMQITSASVQGAVNSGIWRASLNETENETERQRMIADRIEYLERWEVDIRTETTELRAQRNNNSSVSYVARASRLAARIQAFRDAVNETATAAAESELNASGTAELEDASENLSERTQGLPAVDEQLPVSDNVTNGSDTTAPTGVPVSPGPVANGSAEPTTERPETGPAGPINTTVPSGQNDSESKPTGTETPGNRTTIREANATAEPTDTPSATPATTPTATETDDSETQAPATETETETETAEPGLTDTQTATPPSTPADTPTPTATDTTATATETDSTEVQSMGTETTASEATESAPENDSERLGTPDTTAYLDSGWASLVIDG